MKKPRGATPPTPESATSGSASAADSGLFGFLQRALPWTALLVVATFALRRLDDFDTWWHLASGRWIFQNHSIPQTDVLSFTSTSNEWVNLQWLYDLLLYGVWSVGGADLLVVSSAACFVATFALLARHLRMHLGTVATSLLLIWVAATVNERFLLRPEMASFPLLAAVGLVLAEGRRSPGLLRWLIPLMLLWANMHSLFIVGVAAILSAFGGALAAEVPLLPANWRRDSAWPAASRSQLFVWGNAAIAVTLLNPYLLRALLFPLELMSRIDGTNSVYSAIGEFRPPFSGYFQTFAIGSYQAFFYTFGVLAVVAGLARALEARPRRGAVSEEPQGFDLGALALAGALAWLSLLARRNIGIFAIGAVPFVGACLGIVLARLPKSLTAPTGMAVRAMSVLTLVGSLGICGAVASNHWYAVTGETHEFGLGVFESNFQPRAVEFFREQKLPGPLYNDMTAGGYLTWDEPTGQGVYVDGRLEVYDTPFFAAYLGNLSNIPAWTRDADARGIQSVMVFHRWGNRHGFLRALISTRQWMLVYFDETAAILVRAQGNAEVIAKAREAFTTTWRPRTEALLKSDGAGYWWQWPIDRYTGQLAYSELLSTFGEPAGSLVWTEQAIATGLPPATEVATRKTAAQFLASGGRFAEARLHLVRAAELDPTDANTTAMLGRLDELSKN